MENNQSQHPAESDTDDNARKKLILLLVAAAVLLAVVLFFFLRGPGDTEPESLPVPEPRERVQPTPAPAPEPEPEPEPAPEPAPEPEPEPEPLPSLDDSDETLRAELAELEGGERAAELATQEQVLRKVVRAAHALAGGTVVHEYRPVEGPSTPFAAERTEEVADEEINQRFRIQSDNHRRYDPYVSLLARMDPDTLVALYERYLPLLEEANEEHGVDNGGFTQVLIAAIDQALAAPTAPDEIVLVRPRVFYEYEDPALERLPGIQKLMIRMGPENAESVKASLRRLRARLVELD